MQSVEENFLAYLPPSWPKSISRPPKMFKGADFSVVRLWFVVWLGGGGGDLFTICIFSGLCCSKKFCGGEGGSFWGVGARSEYSWINAKNSRRFWLLFWTNWHKSYIPKYAPQSFGWEEEEKWIHKRRTNKVQKIFFYLETKEEESDTSHAP